VALKCARVAQRAAFRHAAGKRSVSHKRHSRTPHRRSASISAVSHPPFQERHARVSSRRCRQHRRPRRCAPPVSSSRERPPHPPFSPTHARQAPHSRREKVVCVGVRQRQVSAQCRSSRRAKRAARRPASRHRARLYAQYAQAERRQRLPARSAASHALFHDIVCFPLLYRMPPRPNAAIYNAARVARYAAPPECSDGEQVRSPFAPSPPVRKWSTVATDSQRRIREGHPSTGSLHTQE